MCRIRRADRANCAHTSCWLIASPGCGQHGTWRLLHAVWTQYLETAGHTRLARGSIRLLIVYEARATALQQTKSTTRARVPPSQDHHRSAAAIGRSVDREKWSLERGVDVGCGKFAWGKQRLGGSISTVAAALRSLSGRFWAGGPTGQQTGQAGQHRTDRTDRTACRTAETVLSLSLACDIPQARHPNTERPPCVPQRSRKHTRQQPPFIHWFDILLRSTNRRRIR